ncbi:hypothetical protein SprV_0501762200 [Sparganum proliferum]
MEAKLQREGYSCVPYTFNPGMVFGEHTHDVDKKDVVVFGELEFTIFGKTVLLKDGDTIVVPKTVPHSAKVVGSRPLEFFDATKNS